ncbi:MAG: hypothetical protein K6F29_01430 [Bacteroidales bacterium]|nr:hypothetical protein [Bacteroidales bacterium]
METYNTGSTIGVRSSYWFDIGNTDNIDCFANENFLTAWFYFFIQPVKTDSIIPIYARFVWDTQSNQWLPIEMIRGDFATLCVNKDFEKESRLFKF